MKSVVVFVLLLALSSANDVKLNIGNFFSNINFESDKGLEQLLKKYEQAELLGNDSEVTAIVNEYTDKVFENIHKFSLAHGLDPINISDVTQDYLVATIRLRDGLLYGISTIKRYEDVIVNYQPSTKVLQLEFPIKFTNLNFTYDYDLTILLLGPKGKVTGKINNFIMDIKLSVDFTKYQISVEKVKSTNSGHVDVIFRESGILDIVVNILSEFITTILHPIIVLIIEGDVSKAVKTAVDAVNDAISHIISPPI